MKPTSYIVTKAQKALLFDIDNEVIITTLMTNRESLALRFIDRLSNDRVRHETLLALWEKGLIRYNYERLHFELTKLGLKFIKLNQRKPTPGVINIAKPSGPYISPKSRRYHGAISKQKVQ